MTTRGIPKQDDTCLTHGIWHGVQEYDGRIAAETGRHDEQKGNEMERERTRENERERVRRDQGRRVFLRHDSK